MTDPGDQQQPPKQQVNRSSETDAKLQDWSKHHKATDDQQQRFDQVATAALEMMRAIDSCCPGGPDKSSAFRLVREARMTAHASITLEGTSADTMKTRLPDSAKEPSTPPTDGKEGEDR